MSALLAIALAAWPAQQFQQGPAQDGGNTPWPVQLPYRSVVLIDGGSIAVSNLPATQAIVGVVTIDGGIIPVTGTFWPASQVVTVDSGTIDARVSNFPANLLTDGGVVNVGNFPASQAVTLSSAPLTQVWGNVLIDGGQLNIGNFPASQAVTIAASLNTTGWQSVDGGNVTASQGTGGASPWGVVVDGGNLNAFQGGTWYTKPGSSTYWACSVTLTTTALTQCQAAPGANLSLYITDIAVYGNTDGGATSTPAGYAGIVAGTGSNCATTDAGIYPSGSQALRIPYQPNSATSTILDLTSPIQAPANTALCVRCTGTVPCTAQLSGYTAP